jgi:hypothetical protein
LLIRRVAVAPSFVGDDDSSGGDLLRAKRDGAQTGTAELVHAPGGRFLRNAGIHRGLTGRVLAFAGQENLTEDDSVHFVGIDRGVLQHALDYGGAEFMRRHIGKRTVEGTDHGAVRAGDGWGGHCNASTL